MKNNLIKLTTAFCIVLFAAGCSKDTTVPDANDNLLTTVPQNVVADDAARAYYWEGTIGEEIDGEYVITADEAKLKADLEAVLRNEGRSTTLQTLFIQKQIADNDPNDTGYFLIGSDKNGITIGVLLDKISSRFELLMQDGFTKTVSCEGCVSGCNLRYLYISGKKVPYCQENGCSEYDCSKSESSF